MTFHLLGTSHTSTVEFRRGGFVPQDLAMVERTDDIDVKGPRREELATDNTDQNPLSGPTTVTFGSPDEDVEKGSSSSVSTPPVENLNRRKPSAVEAQEDLKAFARMHMVCHHASSAPAPLLI